MLRRILKFIIFYAVVAIAVSATFIGVRKVWSDTYSPDASDSFVNGETPLAADTLEGRKLLLAGRYTEGADAGSIYYKIYDDSGKLLKRENLSAAEAEMKNVSVSGYDGGAFVSCLCSPWNRDYPSYGAVFRIDEEGGLSETVIYRAPDEYAGSFAKGFDRFVCADAAGNYFAGISGRNVLVMDRSGAAVSVFEPDYFSEVSDVVCSEGSVLLAGADAESSLGNSFRSALCALYSESGEIKWQKTLIPPEEGYSAALRAEPCGTEFLLAGRIVPSDGGWQNTGRIGLLREADDPYLFHIGPDAGSDASSSLFILKLDGSGGINASAVLSPGDNLCVPAVSGFDSDGRPSMLVLTSYYAEREQAGEYSVNLIRMGRQLDVYDTHTFYLNGDTLFRAVNDFSEGGIFAVAGTSASGSYRVTRFSSAGDAINRMDTVMKLNGIMKFHSVLTGKAPFLFAAGFALMLSVSSAARYKRKRKKK